MPLAASPGSEAPALRARSVSKSFNGVPALVDFDLDIGRGEVHALVGENGSGKSTFIKVLSGFHKPERGEIEVGGTHLAVGRPGAARACGCRFVHQEVALIDALSVADNLHLESGFPTRMGTLRRGEALRQAARLLEVVGLEVDPSTPISALSQGQRTGVAVARAVREDAGAPARLLVLDEPTATLPADDVTMLIQLVRRVAATGVGVLYVSHRLDEVFYLSDLVTVLRDGRKQCTVPTGDLTRVDLVNLVVGDALQEVESTLKDSLAAAPGGRCALQVQDLRSPGIRSASFSVQSGEIVGIAGITGSGRESVLDTVFGGVATNGGTVSIDGMAVPLGSPRASISLGLAYLPPDRKTLGGFMDLSARHNMTITDLSPFWRLGRMRKALEGQEVDRWFEQLSIRPAGSADRKFGEFSGGNQQKILFAKWLRRSMKVFLLDEPTQGVDVGAKAALHKELVAIASGGTAIVISSTDLEELAALCSRVLVFRTGKIVAELSGSQLKSSAIAAECIRVEQKVGDR